jgi:hypothetical protein
LVLNAISANFFDDDFDDDMLSVKIESLENAELIRKDKNKKQQCKKRKKSIAKHT